MSTEAFTGCSIFGAPHAFVDKRNDPYLVMTLDKEREEPLRRMYLEQIERNSFNGLPPVADQACAKWLDGIIADAVNLVAVGFEKGLAGHAGLFPMPKRMCEIMIVVPPPYRARGIGTQLTRCAVECAYEAGMEKMWLSVDAQNYIARHIYVKCGFEYLNTSAYGELDMMLDLRGYRQADTARVSSIMTRHVVSIRSDAWCREAIELFLRNQIGVIPVVDAAHRVVGVLSETDLVGETHLRQRVSDIMTRQAITIDQDWSVARAVRLFRCRRLRCFPVINKRGKLVGVIGHKDIIYHYYRTIWKEGAPARGSEAPQPSGADG
jgi:CBS domain-containing protein/ribosomal protein S18 acetylase RimI-like enzyme